MRSFLLTLWFVLLGLVLVCPSSVPAADPLPPKAIDRRPIPVGGLNVSLVTSGYRFQEVSATAPTQIDDRVFIFPPPSGKTAFVASVSLSNRSRSPITFQFGDAGPRWTFRIVDSADQEVWRSNSNLAAPQVITEDVLGPGKNWRYSTSIPLVIEDTPLSEGIYTLQAYLNADKSVSATSVFEVIPDPSLDTGIKALVLKEVTSGDPATGVTTEVPAVGLQVRVTEILTSTSVKRLPFTWQGLTNAVGRVVVNTPPGRYQVTAYERAIPWIAYPVDDRRMILPPIPVASAQVTVQAGAFSEVTLRYKPATPPAITQGIKGTVTYVFPPAIDDVIGIKSPATDTSTDSLGTTLEVNSTDLIIRVFPAYKVQIAQLETPAGSSPFTWSGYTDPYGKFQVATPPGKFQVTATSSFLTVTSGSLTGIMPPIASSTVTVAPDSVATVNLTLGPGCVYPPPQ